MSQLIYILTYFILFSYSDTTQQIIPFNISEPEIKIELSKELKEISGLTWIDAGQLGAVQDEAGLFYILDSNTGIIKEKIKFSVPGDFEGVELVGNCIYTLTSSGTLFYFDLGNSEDVKKIDTPLSWKNDAEGLAFDAKNNRLLIACKELGSVSDSKFKGKSIFALSIIDHKFFSTPVVTIKKSKIEKFKKVNKFKPSALAIDPLTQDMYVLASAGKLLVVLDSNLKIKAAINLPSKKYAQPEGICFSTNGDLYISNEGVDKKANFYHLQRKW
jgi:uncharacterized protein YjiK